MDCARLRDLRRRPPRPERAYRLHGDAHLEQFALTKDAWGLDDFDDSARGPALIDIVRFLGSIDLAARRRGWTRERETLFDRFFDGYRRGLSEPDHQPTQPEIVGRLRAEAPVTRAVFLAWGDSRMAPMDDESLQAVAAGMAVFARFVRGERPDLAADYFALSRAGWLHMGVGSALSLKILIRVQGPSADPADDELLEAKRLASLAGLPCLDEPPSPPTLRIVAGTKQLGRFTHNILASGPELVLPELAVRGRQLRDWWIRSWEPSYREVRVDDLRSVEDLSAIAYDSGEQLGAGCLREQTGATGALLRKKAFASIAALEGRVRKVAAALVEEVLLGSRELGKR